VLSVFAGLRPLAAPKQGEQKTKEISRSHKIIVSASNLFTILGGKWTTYRKMGEDMVNRVEQQMKWSHRKPATEKLHIHGYTRQVNWDDPFYFYGSDAAQLKQMMNGSAGTWISETLKIHKSQVIWAVHHEMARTVEDVLSRRTRALLLDAKESIRICPEVARLIANQLGMDESWIEKEIQHYTQLAQQYILKLN
jgi:glycerol-3-phosphate dehydrogenase